MLPRPTVRQQLRLLLVVQSSGEYSLNPKNQISAQTFFVDENNHLNVDVTMKNKKVSVHNNIYSHFVKRSDKL